MRLVPKNIKTYPLDWMKNNQTKSKTQVVNNGKGIRN
jgi:hypothetical protein